MALGRARSSAAAERGTPTPSPSRQAVHPSSASVGLRGAHGRSTLQRAVDIEIANGAGNLCVNTFREAGNYPLAGAASSDGIANTPNGFSECAAS